MVIFALIGLWFGGWHYAADRLAIEVENFKQDLGRSQQVLECENQRIEGFPFRIGIFCDQIYYSGDRSGIAYEGGALRSAAHFYQPNKAVIELESPAIVTLPEGAPVNVEWQSLRASVKAGFSGPEQISLHGKDLYLSTRNDDEGVASLPEFQLHLRRFDEDALDTAISLNNFKPVDEPNGRWPGFSLSSIIRLDEIYEDLLRSKNLLGIAQTQGLAGEVQSFEFRPDSGGVLEIQGPMSISAAGRLSGKFKVSFSELDKLAQVIIKAFPESESFMTPVASVVPIFSKPSGDGKLTIPVNAKNGALSIGGVPIGTLPALY